MFVSQLRMTGRAPGPARGARPRPPGRLKELIGSTLTAATDPPPEGDLATDSHSNPLLTLQSNFSPFPVFMFQVFFFFFWTSRIGGSQ